jgi:hypothetical protein
MTGPTKHQPLAARGAAQPARHMLNIGDLVRIMDLCVGSDRTLGDCFGKDIKIELVDMCPEPKDTGTTME